MICLMAGVFVAMLGGWLATRPAPSLTEASTPVAGPADTSSPPAEVTPTLRDGPREPNEVGGRVTPQPPEQTSGPGLDVTELVLRARSWPRADDQPLLEMFGSLGALWSVLEPSTRVAITSALADAIVLRSESPERIDALLAAMGLETRRSVLQALEDRSPMQPPPAAVEISP
ncbi:MAG: hypothetical protein MK101_07855 [Phycisphaerales bacterium]|nr:hypothetical protein [Phycisphaerales bacterium]